MKALIEEYGKIIMCAVIGSAVLLIVISGIVVWYQYSYPEIDSYDGILVESLKNQPIIVGEDIELAIREKQENIDFSKYISAYSDSSMEESLEIEIDGEENVDVTQQGIYQIFCSATNSNGYTYSKRISVLVY